MKSSMVLVATLALLSQAGAQQTLFDFDSLAAHSGLPIDATAGGITAHMTATGQGFSIQAANTLGFTPAGFAGNCIYPDSVFAADLQIQFSQPINNFSIMYAPEEYACDSSARMRVTAYMDSSFVGTATTTAPNPGTYPTGVLKYSTTGRFNYVVVHYDAPPPTGGDWGPIFLADNMRVTAAAGPFAVNDQYTVSAGQVLNVATGQGVLANDQGAAGTTVVLVGNVTHGTLTLAQDGSFTYTPNVGFVGSDTFTYKDSIGAISSNNASVKILVQPVLTGLTILPFRILGGQKTQGTVALSVAAPSGGTTVMLADNSGDAIESSKISVPAGAKTAVFNITTRVVPVLRTVDISATLGAVTKHASLSLYPLSGLKSLVATPVTVVGGTGSLGTVVLLAPVPVGSEVIPLSSGSTLISVPVSVTVGYKASSAHFAITTVPVSSTTTGAFSASFNGVKLTETITITLPPISNLQLLNSTVKGGTSTTATITLGGNAGTLGDSVSVTMGTTDATGPTTVKVPAGKSSVTFTVSTKAVTAIKNVVITAKLGTSTKTVTLTITP